MQASAERSFSASDAMLLFWNFSQAKSHSLLPPAAMALQYTVRRRLGWILDGLGADGQGFEAHANQR